MNKTYQKAIWKCYWRPLVVLAFDHRVLSLDSTSHLPSNQNKENNPSPEIKPATQKGKKNKNQIFQILIKKKKKQIFFLTLSQQLIFQTTIPSGYKPPSRYIHLAQSK